ncbi:MAG: hypothetical protein ACP5D8_04280, partial [Fidelibacterota bacterium]
MAFYDWEIWGIDFFVGAIHGVLVFLLGRYMGYWFFCWGDTWGIGFFVGAIHGVLVFLLGRYMGYWFFC